MIAYKLFRLKANGAITPLFINKVREITLGEWMDAEDHPTNGFANRPGWHCGTLPTAPHLKKDPVKEVRVWAKVEVEDYYNFKRPRNQGGFWIIAKRMQVLNILTDDEVLDILKHKKAITS